MGAKGSLVFAAKIAAGGADSARLAAGGEGAGIV